jgi:superfamily II DNA or RNA helicase
MLLHVRNKTTRVDFDLEEEEEWLDDLLAVDVPNAKYVPAYKRGQWDGKKRFLNGTFSTFPTGLLPLVLRDNEQYDIEVVDKRKAPFPKVEDLTVVEWTTHLEDVDFTPDAKKCWYQVKGINKILNKTVQGLPWPRGVVQLPTGSGKTILAAGLLWAMDQPSTLFLCNRLDLLVQSKKVLEDVLQTEIGILGAGKKQLENITVATVQTLRTKHLCLSCNRKFSIKKRRCTRCKSGRYKEVYVDDRLPEWLKRVQVLIIDECHKVGFNEYSVVLSRVPAYYRIGLSATPFSRRDPGDVLLVGVTGETVARLRTSSLTNKGVLAHPVIELVACQDPRIDFEPYDRTWTDARRRREAMRRYRIAYRDGVVQNGERNGIIASLAKLCVDNGWPTLILVKQILHGRILSQALSSFLPNVAFLHGSAKLVERTKAVAKFKKGLVPVLIASTIFDEAVDIPNIKAMILAGAGNSPIKTIQRVGRGMRAKKGDNKLYVYDFLDLTSDVLREQSMNRISIYEAQGYTVLDEVKDV